jgi:DNA-binding HxlR family transcriptional regulator
MSIHYPLSITYQMDSSDLTLGNSSQLVDSQCRAFQLAIDVLGRPWNALILNVLLEGSLRFNALKARAQGPGDRVLSARLKDLEARRLLVRNLVPGPPVQVIYSLTPKGRAFAEVAQAIERWGRTLARP